MTIKRVGFITFIIKFDDISLITDPLISNEAMKSFKKASADIAILSDPKLAGKENIFKDAKFKKLVPKEREDVFVVSSPGEYETGGVMIRRPINSDYYIFDEGNVRVLYMGQLSKAINPDKLGDMGDVDLLILPVGDAEMFPNFDKLENIIKKVDPTYIIPCGYQEEGLDKKFADLKTVDEFIKQSGVTHVSHEKKFTVNKGTEIDNKFVEVIVLE